MEDKDKKSVRTQNSLYNGQHTSVGITFHNTGLTTCTFSIQNDKNEVSVENGRSDLSDVKKSVQRLIGVVTRCESYDSYTFIVTNQYGVKDYDSPSHPVQLYLDKKQWKDSVSLEEGMWVTFELRRQTKSVRHAAMNARSLSQTIEDLSVCRNYFEAYGTIEGLVNGSRLKKSILKHIQYTFYNQSEGRKIILEDLYNRKCCDSKEWELLLSNMPEEEMATFELDASLLEVTPKLRLALYKYNRRVDILKDDSIILSLASKDSENNLSVSLFEESFHTEEDRNDWINYASSQDVVTDKLRSLLYILSISPSVLSSVQDRDTFIRGIAASQKGVVKLISNFLQDEQNTELYSVISEISDDSVLDSLKQLSEQECIKYILRIPKDKAASYISDSRLEEFSLKENLLSSEKGRAILIEGLYRRKSEEVSEWDEILTFNSENNSSFVFDENRLKPTAELRLYLYWHLHSVDWLLHPCVISYMSRQKDDAKVKEVIDSFANDKDLNTWLKFVAESPLSNEAFLVKLFYQANNLYLYDAIENKVQIIDHYNDSGVMGIKRFLSFVFKYLTDADLKWIHDSLNYEKLLGGLQKLPADTCIQWIRRLPEEAGIKIATSEQFKSTNVFRNFIGEKWETRKSEIQYVVFDLESDGDSISEFAFCSEDNMRSYTGEDQLKSLIRNLKKQPIIVGHNIEQWDLPILFNKGLNLPDKTFIWDTLEMEILLNPCRYAYSLHTEHNAVADTKLTNELFWNQLYRLSIDEHLVESLREVLPKDIKTILSSLQIDYFSEYFSQTANLDLQFFQELRPLSDKTLNELNKIAEISSDEETLIIAPQNIWARLAQYIPLFFPCKKEFSLSIDIHKLKDSPLEDAIKQTILERFCAVSKTPLVNNLAQYLRVVGESDNKITFTDEFLEDYVSEFKSHIDCIDVNGFDCPNVLAKNYKHIFLIGTELDDRIHKCRACDNKTFADLLACGSKLPFTMAATNYAPVKDSEITKLGIKMPELAANVWVERERNGQFAFYLNYQYQSYRASFLDHFSVKPKIKKWEFKGTEYRHINLTQVSRVKTADMVMRVSNSTTQRSKYWLFQFALIGKIHSAHPDKAIIYIVNVKDELEELIKYATSLGYYLPSSGTDFRKLEYIGNHNHGMVIITKKEFTEGIGSYRTDKAYCYVWDNMDIDRYMLMWGKLPFDDDLEEDVDDERDDKVRRSTPRQCIHAAWPIYEHYSSLVMANNKDTQCFVIDPYFDDYEDIASSCHAQVYKFDLWESNELYAKALNISSTYFDDSRTAEKEIDTATAMELIRKTFIGGFDWKETQKEVLPHMIEKREDCIISMPTGEGKSVCFQGPAIFRASISRKLSLVITPLRALMQDQVENLQKRGFTTNVDYLSGDRQRPEVENIYRKIRSGELALLFITPERFRVKSFINVLYQRMEMDGGLEYIVFDEAHCISQWGQDFRPDFRSAVLKCKELREQYTFMIAMFSATVTSQVEADIRSFLPNIQRLGQSADDYNPIRQHIGISFNIVTHADSARISEIVDFVVKQNIDFSKSCMIIFCRTHRQCEDTADTLNKLAQKADSNSALLKCADKIGFYHAGLDADLRNDVYEQFKRVKGVEPLYILCATKAFGMGMDIPNVHYVVHYNPPSVLEDFLQEVGRAGRDEEMYKCAFENGKQIPALCLTSKDDFKKLKELLVKSQMSWSNLTDAKDRIVDYIKRFQTLEITKSSPIVVPFDVWIKNSEELNDTTPSRLAFHWLEKIGCIKQQYLSQAHIDISIIKRDKKSKLYSQPVYRYLIDNTKEDRCLVSINDMRSILRISMPKIMNHLIQLMRDGLIELNETMRCNLVPRRYCETRYMVKHEVNQFALHIVFQGLRNLLSDCKESVMRFIGQDEREYICKHLMDDVKYTLIETNYMPWKNEDTNPPKMAVLKYDTFKKNIITRMGAQMFSILYYLPMVTYTIEHQEDEVICQIRVKNNSWYSYLEELEADCLQMIKFVVNQTGSFNWAKAIIDLGWSLEKSHKGYRYFEDVLSVLHHLAYIEHSPLSKSGIEILATDSTELPIEEGTDEQSVMFAHRKDFDNQEQIKKIRLACMDIFSLIKKEQQGDYIRRYFQSRSYEDYLSLAGDYAPEDSDILAEISEEALEIEEKKLGNNAEQKTIYEQPKNINVNVLAGPGAGKTHVLTLRCARLIYKEHIDPSHILVLAYNRAVVVELRNRLNILFTKLGMSRIAHQLHVYTFHALAKKCLGQRLDAVSTEMWEIAFLEYLRNNVADFIAHFRNIEFVLVDEFQDITHPRLDALFCIHKIFKDTKFFTIGDINQSIYGFDRIPRDEFGCKQALTPEQYAEVLKPQPYYEKWAKVIKPSQLSMFTNYRSYQEILDKAAKFIAEGEVPHSAETLMQFEPKEPYVYEINNNVERNRQWFVELPSIINWAIQENITASTIEDINLKRHRHIDTIAVFFRTNNEVYRGYSKIKNSALNGVRIRIQGESIGEFWREREIYYLIDTLLKYPQEYVSLKNDKTANGIKHFLKEKMEKSPMWDSFLLDVAYCLALNYIDSIRADSESHTWKELADYIKEVASRDDAGQVYKIYENYKSERILQEPVLNIVLTTMHKVKGLEFDIIVTTPSFAGLPLRKRREYQEGETPWIDDLADIEEERRLMYVAYTRAKKRLYIYKAEREYSLDNNRIYLAPDHKALRYTEVNQSLDKYFLSFSAKERLFEQIDSYVQNNIKKDDPVKISKDQYGNYCIMHNGRLIGRLSKNSAIARRANEDNINELSDFYISSVFVWTYEDTTNSDTANGTDFTNMWSNNAKNQGYINIVQIAGFGTPSNDIK